jgi:hypothetical protein
LILLLPGISATGAGSGGWGWCAAVLLLLRLLGRIASTGSTAGGCEF